MAVTAHWYAKAFVHTLGGSSNLASDALKCALVTSSYTANQSTDEFWSTPQADEVTGTGYTAGGAALTSVTVTNSGTTIALAAANVSWASSTITAAGAVVYDSTPGTAATDPVLVHIDFGGNVSSSSGTFQITWDASGIGTVTVS